MSCSIVTPSNGTMHVVVTRMGSMTPAITTVGMIVVETVDMMPVVMYEPAVVVAPISRVIVPIPRRIPYGPIGSPEPIINNRTSDIYRLDYVVGSIHILITDYLNRHLLCTLIFFNKHARYILIDVFCKYSLQNNKVSVTICSFNYAYIVNITISVQIEVAYTTFWVV